MLAFSRRDSVGALGIDGSLYDPFDPERWPAILRLAHGMCRADRGKDPGTHRRRIENMKNRYLLALPLAATLMVPAMAQQSSSTDNQQPAATQTQSAPAQPAQDQTSTASDQNTSARQPLQPQLKQGFWGHLNPFARKKYLERQISPIRNRVNELDELTANNSKALKDLDARTTERRSHAN